MTPTLGRVVLYRVSQRDADDMNKRRADYAAYVKQHPAPIRGDDAPRSNAPGTPGATGHVAHYGNQLHAGQEFPAIVVALWPASDAVNLQVFLDGTDTLWATSRMEGTEDGTWHWPERAPEPVQCDPCAEAGEPGSVPEMATMAHLNRLRSELGLEPFTSAGL